MKDEIKTERLILRRFKYDDIFDLYDYAKESNVGPDAGWRPHSDIYESESLLSMYIRNREQWAIQYKKTGKVIGSIGFHRDPLRGTLKSMDVKCLGYALSYNFWGLGLATEACKAIIQHAFENMSFTFITVNHYAHNKRSKRVIEKCGFKYEGTLRNALPSHEGKPMDIVCYSLTKQEWLEFNNYKKL